MVTSLYYLATAMQAIAVAYALWLLFSRGGKWAFLWLIGAMLSMLVWRIMQLTGITPPPFFNPTIAIWGSTCLFLGMFLFGKEVLRREQVERQRDLLLDSERSARESAERANRAKDEFLATLSHELRTPLTAILGWTQLLETETDRDTVRDGHEAIARNARLQLRLVNDLLDVSRFHAGKLRLEPAIVDWSQIVAAVAKELAPGAAAEVRTDVAPGITVSGDPARLQQVVNNLLGNAIKFTPGGTIDITLQRDADQAVLTVRDSGIGIDGDFLPRIFSRFQQADGSIARRRGGLGLGLSICRSLVELHGGTITAHSDGTDKGSTFVVRLPVAAGTPQAVYSPALPTEHILAGLNVLLIEDDADVRDMVSRTLTQFGATVATAGCAADAEARLASNPADVVVSDIGMPDEDGYSMMKRWRRDPNHAGHRVPAVALTAYARQSDRTETIAAGFFAHLPKPVDPAQLADTLRRAVDAARGTSIDAALADA